MGTWNVRILHCVYEDGEHEYFPAEVFYSDKKATKPTGYGTFHCCGDKLDDLKFYANEILAAIEKPILESGDAFPIEHTMP